MPRAIWTGAISFGLVNVPVRMYSAIDEHKLHFNYIHEKDGSRIGYEKVCKSEGKPVPDDEIVKAFEWEKGEYVPMRDEDFERAQEDTYKSIDIRDFVDYDGDRPDLLRAHVLPRAAGRGGEGLRAARPLDAGVRPRCDREVRDARPPAPRLPARLRRRAAAREDVLRRRDPRGRRHQAEASRRATSTSARSRWPQALIDKLYGPFEPEKYEDTYRDTLCEIIKAKRAGETIEAPEPEKPKAAPDLMAALKASLEQAGGASSNGGGLTDLSKAELYERAKQKDIPGRADMSKDELVKALSAA